MRARAAEVTDDPAVRRILLDAAARLVATAHAGRPEWGEAEMLSAYIDTLAAGGRIGPSAVAALERSYRFAPYLREAGLWRAPAGFAAWGSLTAATRARVVNEAVWLGRISSPDRVALFSAARASTGYAPFAARWLAARQGDADVVAALRR